MLDDRCLWHACGPRGVDVEQLVLERSALGHGLRHLLGRRVDDLDVQVDGVLAAGRGSPLLRGVANGGPGEVQAEVGEGIGQDLNLCIIRIMFI